jgi:hypothetical protein
VSGAIERGLRADLRLRGIKASNGFAVATALRLARRLDSADIEDKDLTAMSNALRLLMIVVFSTSQSDSDTVGGLQKDAASKLAP